MNEMVERVAQAIHDEWTGKTIEVRWAALREETRDELRRCARAAIAAMRVPTDEMIQAADECEDYATYYASAETILGAMIDAALAEPVTKT